MESWLQASLILPRDLAAQAERLMESQGAVSVTLSEVGDRPILEPGVGETPLWDRVRVVGLFAGDTPREMLAAVLSLAPGVDSPDQVSLDNVADRDWERAWLDDLEPMQFGDGLWIVPTGREAPAAARTVMRLDPGLAFGTGAHPTTRLCLEWIDALDMEGLDVLDYGCGSGVLGIAAALKGARQVHCVDNDPQALMATRDNAVRNSVAGRIIVHGPDVDSLPAVDVVLANILAGPLVSLASRLCATLARGGRIALSGILEHQADVVSAAYAGRIGSMEKARLEGWVLLAGKDKARD